MVDVVKDMVLEGRYRIDQTLGESRQGRSWLGVDSATGERVVGKELMISRVEDWKSVELFEREGAALRAISHPAVPRYIESRYVEGDGRDSRFLIVQAFVDGEDLQQRVERGELLNEVEIRELLRQMGEVLVYLHGLSPVVIHRDIQPSNVIFSKKDRRYSLVDFGAVQAIQPDEMGGSTVVGTSGYLAAEQLIGRAVAGSDLYALAATVVHLASGVEPWKLPVVKLRMQYRDRVELSDELLDLLDSMLEPSIGLRMSSAGELLAELDRLESLVVREHSRVKSWFVLAGMVLLSPIIVVLPAGFTVMCLLSLAAVPYLDMTVGTILRVVGGMVGMLAILAVYWVLIVKMFRNFWRSSKKRLR